MNIQNELIKKGIYITHFNYGKDLKNIILNTRIKSEDSENNIIEAKYKMFMGPKTSAHFLMRKYLYNFLKDIDLNFADIISKCDSTVIQRIMPGEQLPLHKDAEYEERLLYLVLIYITDSDNYIGREFYWRDKFTNEIKSHKPQNGDIIIIDTKLEHGVNMLASDNNITTFVYRINNV